MEFILNDNKIYPGFRGTVFKIDNRIGDNKLIYNGKIYKCNKKTFGYLTERFDGLKERIR